MTRVATPKNEEFPLGIARHGTAAHVEKVVANYRRCHRLEVLEEENNRQAHRELSWYTDGDSVRSVHALRQQYALKQNKNLIKFSVFCSGCRAAEFGLVFTATRVSHKMNGSSIIVDF